MTKSAKTETEIAVLQLQVKNVEEKVSELKEDMKEIKDSIHNNNEEIKTILKELKEDDEIAHRELGKKISALENWRWMIVGGLALLAVIGFDTIKLLFK